HVLKEIKVPTLFTCGHFDLVTPESTASYAKQVDGAEIVIFEGIAHLTVNEDPKHYVEVIRKFLNKTE
ncbi:MAG: alpha/beta hydrolase, partial [Flavobacteriaceae bacterium]